MIFPLSPSPSLFFSINIDSSRTRLPAISRVIVLSKAWRAGRHLSQYWPDIGNLRSGAITARTVDHPRFPVHVFTKLDELAPNLPVEIQPRFRPREDERAKGG